MPESRDTIDPTDVPFYAYKPFAVRLTQEYRQEAISMRRVQILSLLCFSLACRSWS